MPTRFHLSAATETARTNAMAWDVQHGPNEQTEASHSVQGEGYGCRGQQPFSYDPGATSQPL